MEEVDEQELHVERVAAFDLGKTALEACVRVPHETRPGRRLQEVRGYATTTRALLALADWLHSWGVTRVVMESTSGYWKGADWLLEAEGFECWLVSEPMDAPWPHRRHQFVVVVSIGTSNRRNAEERAGAVPCRRRDEEAPVSHWHLRCADTSASPRRSRFEQRRQRVPSCKGGHWKPDPPTSTT
jgi:hypothetical protein